MKYDLDFKERVDKMCTWDKLKRNLPALDTGKKQLIESMAHLYAQRVKQGISQRELAERIWMKQAQIAQIEELDVVPSFETLQRYAKGLGLVASISFKPLNQAD